MNHLDPGGEAHVAGSRRLSWIGRLFAVLAGTVTLFGLASPDDDDGRMWGTVFLDGQPLAGAQVSYANDTRVLGGAGRSDDQGRVFVYSNSAARKLLVWHEGLQAELDAQTLTNQFRVELQSARGSVEGRLWRGRQPWPGRLFNLVRAGLSGDARPFHTVSPTNRGDIFAATTDAEGRFRFEGVPAGHWTIGSRRKWGEAAGTQAANSAAVQMIHQFNWGEAEVKPGQTTQIELGRNGATLFGQAVGDDPARALSWYGADSFLVTHSAAREPVVVNGRFIMGEIEADGSFAMPFVPAGTFEFVIRPEGMPAAGPRRNAWYLGAGKVPVTVSAEQAAAGEAFDLGVVTVKLRRQLKVGELAPDFELETFAGGKIRLADYRGKVALLAFWSEMIYYAGTPAQMTDLKRLQNELKADARLVVLGVHLGPDLAKARQAASDAGWTWPQACGAEKRELFEEQYESAHPGDLFLIGPDGRVLARHYQTDALRPAVDQALAALAKPPGR